jgi:hypothetical protein
MYAMQAVKSRMAPIQKPDLTFFQKDNYYGVHLRSHAISCDTRGIGDSCRSRSVPISLEDLILGHLLQRPWCILLGRCTPTSGFVRRTRRCRPPASSPTAVARSRRPTGERSHAPGAWPRCGPPPTSSTPLSRQRRGDLLLTPAMK